jgi:hypothetical protein
MTNDTHTISNAIANMYPEYKKSIAIEVMELEEIRQTFYKIGEDVPETVAERIKKSISSESEKLGIPVSSTSF